MKALKLFFCLSVLMVSSARADQVLKSVPNEGHIAFLALGHPAMIHIRGESPGPQGQASLKGLSVQGHFVLPLETLSTGIGMRDHHMKEKYLETKKYPEAVLDVPSLTLPAGDHADQVPLKGNLQLHGVTKPVQGHLDFASESNGKKVHAEFSLKLSDFGIEIPSYAGISVADEVQIQLDMMLR